MRKLLNVIIAGLLSLTMIFSLSACQNAEPNDDPTAPTTPTTPTNPTTPEQPEETEKPSDNVIGPEIKEPPELADPAHPADDGVKIAYRMESESAYHTLDGEPIAFSDDTNLRFSTLYSGCLVTGNLSKLGNVHTFTFNSDKALSGVALVIMIAINSGESAKLSDMIEVRMNGERVNVNGLTMNSADCACLDPFTSTYSKYMYFKENTLFVTLEKGENVLEIEHVSTTGGNLDYVELQTSAQITGFDNTKFWDSTARWELVTEPTKTTTGSIKSVRGTATRTYVLPVLAVENGYTVTETDDGIEYSFMLKGEKFYFVDDGIVIPDDEGPFSSYRMESESAVHTQNGTQVAFDDNTHLRFSTLYSGCLVTGNLSAVGTVHTFNFNSDKAVANVQLAIMIAVPENTSVNLSEMITVRVNGKTVSLDGLLMDSSKLTSLDPFTSTYTKYMYFKENVVYVTLQKGANKIEIEHVSTTGGNFDYIELKTSANITGFDNTNFWDTDAVWTVTQEPTLTATGKIRMTKGTTREYVLPVLSASNGYTVTATSGGTEYSFTLKGQKYAFTV